MAEEQNVSLYEQLVKEKKELNEGIAKLEGDIVIYKNRITTAQNSIAGISCRTFCNGQGTKDVVCTTAANLATLQSLQDNLKACTRNTSVMASAIAQVNQKAAYDQANATISQNNTNLSNATVELNAKKERLKVVEADLAKALDQSKNVEYLRMTPEQRAAAEEAEAKAKLKRQLITWGAVILGLTAVTLGIIFGVKYYRKVNTI